MENDLLHKWFSFGEWLGISKVICPHCGQMTSTTNFSYNLMVDDITEGTHNLDFYCEHFECEGSIKVDYEVVIKNKIVHK